MEYVDLNYPELYEYFIDDHFEMNEMIEMGMFVMKHGLHKLSVSEILNIESGFIKDRDFSDYEAARDKLLSEYENAFEYICEQQEEPNGDCYYTRFDHVVDVFNATIYVVLQDLYREIDKIGFKDKQRLW